jgi:2-dehydro-3-deoxyphosphogalactonate aldolase
MQVMPGFATASEAFAAVEAGAHILKLFPAATYGPKHLRALREVLPAGTKIYPVGGIGAADVGPWLEAGAGGFGFGSELFKPQFTLEEITARAARVVEALAKRPS